MPTLSISHPLLRFPLLLAALAFAWWAAKTGQAGIYQFQANSYVELWQHQRLKNPDFQVSNEQYQSTLDKSRQALNLVPYNTDYWTTIADMQLWYLSNTANIPITQQTIIKSDIFAAYRTALKQRPTWPYSYSNFAAIKARFGEVDSEFIHALHKANQLGANETEVIHITIELGLILWSQLDKSTQKLVANAVERSITWDSSSKLNNKERVFALSLVGAYQKQAEICALMSVEGQKISNMCAS